MEEIKLASNQTGLRVLINGKPEVRQIHENDFGVWAAALDIVLTEHIQNYYKYKSRGRPKAK